MVNAQDLYFPTVEGSRRVLQRTLGDRITTVTETITKVERVDGEHVVTLSRENSAYGHDSGKRFNEYMCAVSPSGLFLVRNIEGKSENRKPLLKLPAKAGVTWINKSRDEEQDLDETASFTIGKEELVSVPAGQYLAIPVVAEYTFQRQGRTLTTSKSKLWYAAGVGVVKSVYYRDGTDDLVSELKEFVLGKAK
ncbi:hypothetical protein Enr13x_67500 [Stieleria neptunia]|uniref:DUF3108 domain-containing protein n=1 Tax=Stieleria neptunia TaxID=2527979 RepID=A0A518I184_9BACT|nr:hypothetical protein [Stieleria neptunia]QDV46841.1 hypothetical protein Enr13x_67500 [Stieleria neptunia]